MLWRGDRTLIIKRGPHVQRAGYWCPPSGRVEPGETAAQTVVREAREELGVDVAPDRVAWTCPTDDGTYQLQWWLADLPADAEITPDPSEVAEARWVTVDEFRKLSPKFDDDLRFYTEIWPTIVSQ